MKIAAEIYWYSWGLAFIVDHWHRRVEITILIGPVIITIT